jgi:acetyl-CoA/propionyl-CoA carboxylase biotin carboxyl carrier protein
LDESVDESAVADAHNRWGTDATGDGTDDEVVEREFTVEVNGRRFDVMLEDAGSVSQAATTDEARERPTGADTEDDQESHTAVDGPGETVRAEMQGTVLSVEVSEGDEVSPGDVVLVLEAMKMENDVETMRGGTVTEVFVEDGQSVDMDDPLVVVE